MKQTTYHSKSMTKVKVLLCGMNRTPNQFSRALDRYPNVEVIHFPGDPGKRFDTTCDALIRALCHTSHDGSGRTYDAYRAMKKPIFTTHSGFSSIKAEFETWLDAVTPEQLEVEKTVPAPLHTETPKTVLQVAFEAASSAAAQSTGDTMVPKVNSSRVIKEGTKMILDCIELK